MAYLNLLLIRCTVNLMLINVSFSQIPFSFFYFIAF